jgi:hypothetical protein
VDLGEGADRHRDEVQSRPAQPGPREVDQERADHAEDGELFGSRADQVQRLGVGRMHGEERRRAKGRHPRRARAGVPEQAVVEHREQRAEQAEQRDLRPVELSRRESRRRSHSRSPASSTRAAGSCCATGCC